MSANLRSAVADAGPEVVRKLAEELAESARRALEFGDPGVGLLYARLAHELMEPAADYSVLLVAAAAQASHADGERVTRELFAAVSDDEPLLFAAAAELGSAVWTVWAAGQMFDRDLAAVSTVEDMFGEAP